jgi:hypothetical protein
VGLAGFVTGAVILYFAVLDSAFSGLSECVGSCADHPPRWMWYAGGASLGAGLALGVTGVIVWRANAHATVRSTPLDDTPPPPYDARLRLTPAAGRQWAGLALTGRF